MRPSLPFFVLFNARQMAFFNMLIISSEHSVISITGISVI